MSNLIQNEIYSEHSQFSPSNLHPKAFGKVAVLYGGRSAERAISLQSGENILQSLQKQGVDAHGIDVDEHLAIRLVEEKFDRVFIALHGKEGEDGLVQGLIQMLGIPYTGSNVAASALAMDKARAKLVMSGFNIPTPIFGVAKNVEAAYDLAKKIGFPLSIKPVSEGSSIGVTRVAKQEDIADAFELAAHYGDVIVEKWIDGKDFFVSILGNNVLPSVEVHASKGFYDFQAKYESDETQYLCPAPISTEKEQTVRAVAYNAFCALGCQGWGRVDLIQDKHGDFWVLEVNTIPGMTSHSLVPMSANAAGISFDELVLSILATSMAIDQFSKVVGEVAQI